MTSCEFAAIGWVITLFGLFFADYKANKRETRKEIRAKLDQLNAAMDALLDASKNYYLDKNAILILEIVKIHEKINTCDTIIDSLSSAKNLSIKTEFYAIYDKITGGNFESKQHKPSEHFAELCTEVAKLKQVMLNKSEQWLYKNYH